MPGKNKIDHYERMGQRNKLFKLKQGEEKVNFGVNILNEHISFYVKQGFNKEDSIILISSTNRVKDFFGLKLTIKLGYLYEEGKFNIFFKTIIDFIKNSNNNYRLENIEILMESLVFGLKNKKNIFIAPKINNKIFSILFKKNSTIDNENIIQSKKKIIYTLNNISILLCLNERIVNGIELSKIIHTSAYGK